MTASEYREHPPPPALAGPLVCVWTQTIGTAGRLIAGDAQVRTDIERTASDNRFAYAPAIAIGVVLVALSW